MYVDSGATASDNRVHGNDIGIHTQYTATVDARGMPASPGTLGDDCFVVVEKWASLAALQAHAVAPHMKAYAARVKELMAKRVIHVLEPAEAG